MARVIAFIMRLFPLCCEAVRTNTSYMAEISGESGPVNVKMNMMVLSSTSAYTERTYVLQTHALHYKGTVFCHPYHGRHQAQLCWVHGGEKHTRHP